MEEFLTDYVQMTLDVNGAEISAKQMTALVNKLMNDDEIWETLDMRINDEIEILTKEEN